MKAIPYNWSSMDYKFNYEKKPEDCNNICDNHEKIEYMCEHYDECQCEDFCECCNECKCNSDSKDHHKCEGCACAFFSKLKEGTIVTVIGDSGTMYDMVIFKKFDRKNCCVTLKDEDVSPPETSIIKIDCRKIESVSFTTDY
ncbi:hypothetical protein [Metabacillus fastidiosus]|uniref:hypothetical protein n=1 Tax=Metabacillus fastidiosus TaxID=1458 RepID=UPI003D2B2EE1